MDRNARAIREKVDELNKVAWEIRVADSNKALMLSQEAVTLSKGIGYTKGTAEGLRTLGFSYVRLSKHAEAKILLCESLELFGLLDDARGKSDVYEYLGIIQRSFGNYQESLDLLFKSHALRLELAYPEGESLSLYHIGVTYKYLGNLEQALEYFLKGLSIAGEIHYWVAESYCLNNIGGIYFELGNYDNALRYFHESLVLRKKQGDEWGEAGCLDNIGYAYFKKGDYSLAKEYCERSLAIAGEVGDKKGEGNSFFHLAEINYKINNPAAAYECASKGLEIRERIEDKKGQAELCLFLAEMDLGEIHGNTGTDPRLDFLNKALILGEDTNTLDLSYKIHAGFYKLFKERKQYFEALTHFELFNEIEKQIHSETINQKILSLEISHNVEQSAREAEIYRLRNVELAGLYEESNKQKEEIQRQKASLEQTVLELRSAQTQLIQSEKMALLGELTAGIAHEIQNPLNFINNFSEVNAELIDELESELDAGNKEDAISCSQIIKDNQQKITHHGKRADAIVRGMLQHSRKSTGQKEPTDINALADEYLRLSYHGLRAKDKSFNAAMQTFFDESIGKVDVIPQDIGRVLLNLITNAFYSVAEKKEKVSEDFVAMVTVSTKARDNMVEIKIEDNGMGISQNILDKIYQPFFSTKPTGKGTGLGLSLSYDIVKAHDGQIEVQTREGEFASFIIHLPLKNTQ
jgi:two-component system NtrC family sensor kinase